jgi:hypothetical protein
MIFEHVDSSVIMYSGNNGFDELTGGWKYDSTVRWFWSKTIPFWSDDVKIYQQLINNRIVSTQSHLNGGGTWEAKDRTSYTYKNGKIDSTITYYNYGKGIEPASLHVNQYNANKHVMQTTGYSWDAGSKQWLTAARTTYHYNNDKLPDTILFEGWVGGSSSWVKTQRTVNTYAGQRQETSVRQLMSMSGWVNDSRSSYSYDAKGKMRMTEEEEWDQLAADWEMKSRVEYSYSNEGDNIEQKIAAWDGAGWVDMRRTRYAYNQHHRVTSEESHTWDPTTNDWIINSWDINRKFYYEAYTNAVPEVAGRQIMLDVFPVPAKDRINISASFKTIQPVLITLTDMSGKIMRQHSEQAGVNYRSSLDVADLPAGNYIINITGSNEQAAKTISIVR